MKQIAVIGAGVAGLASAIRLQHLGHQVHIYEKNHKPGGKMHQIKEQGFTFDVGPTIVMMKDMYEEVFTFCGRDLKDYMDYGPVDPMLTLHFSKDEAMPLSTDLTKLIHQLEGISDEDAQGYLAFLADIYKRYLIAKDHFLTRSFRSAWDFYNPRTIYQALRLRTFNDAYSSIAKFVKDDRLRKSLAFQTLYIGISPYQGPSLYSIIPMIELFYGVQYFKGGMHAYAKAMEKLFLELGGQIHYGASVDEIIVEGKKTTGIRLGETVVPADAIICNADFPHAMVNLLPDEKTRGKYSDKKIAKMEYSCSCFLLYLGVDKEYDLGSLHNIFFAQDFQKNVNDLFEEGKLPTDPSYYIYSPSQVDETMAPEGHQAIYVLVPVPELSLYKDWSDQAVAAYRDLILSKMKAETVFEDIDEHIVFEQIYTPKDFEERFNAFNGATFGLKPTLLQSNYFRPQPKFKAVDNLYFCGSSTHPGAGVPIVLMSAQLAVEEFLRDNN
ncbi:phytoene desaturase family protein [Streptococcus rifensis]